MSQPALLDSVSTSDLIDELVRRCKPAVFIGTRTDDAGEHFTFYQIAGHPHACYALCQEMAFKIQLSETRKEVKNELEDTNDP